MNTDTQLLEDIFHQTVLIMQVSAEIDDEEFFSNEFCQNGFIRSLEIIGEAAKKCLLSFVQPIRKFRGEGWQDYAINSYMGMDL